MKAPAANLIGSVAAEPVSTAGTEPTRAYLRTHWRSYAWLLVGSLLVAGPLFCWAAFGQILADHAVHIGLIQRGIETGIWPAHFLFHALVYAVSGFQHDATSLAWAVVAVLTLCVFAKAGITYALLVRHCPRLPSDTFEDEFRLSHPALLLIVTGALMLAAPIVRPWLTQRIYLGQISPNVWHNPTIIVCWPLVMLLFFAAAAFLRSGKTRALAAIGVLSAVSVLAKPNYFLAFAPVFTLLAWGRFGFSRQWLLSQAALVPTVLLLVWQVVASFHGPNAMRPDVHIALLPLAAWHINSSSIMVSLAFSLAFPLSYLLIYWHRLQNGKLLLFAWAVMLSALAWTALFAEVHGDGTVDIDFNFSWGSHLALFVLFVVTAMDMLDNPTAMKAIGPRALGSRIAGLPWWLLGAHAASGVLWLVRQAIGRSYF